MVTLMELEGIVYKAPTDGKICNWYHYRGFCVKIKRNRMLISKKVIAYFCCNFQVQHLGASHDILNMP
jgi:hypothetical protein